MVHPNPNQKGLRLQKGENNEVNQQTETGCEGKDTLEQSVVKQGSALSGVNEPWAVLGCRAHAPVREHSK